MKGPTNPFSGLVQRAVHEDVKSQRYIEGVATHIDQVQAFLTLEQHRPHLADQALLVFGQRAPQWFSTIIPFYGVSPLQLMALERQDLVEQDLALQAQRTQVAKLAPLSAQRISLSTKPIF